MTIKSKTFFLIRLNPDYAQAMNNLGNLMKDRGNYEEAEKLFKRALELQ